MAIWEDEVTKGVLKEQGSWATRPVAISVRRINWPTEISPSAVPLLQRLFFMGWGVEGAFCAPFPKIPSFLSFCSMMPWCVRGYAATSRGYSSHMLSSGVR